MAAAAADQSLLQHILKIAWVTCLVVTILAALALASCPLMFAACGVANYQSVCMGSHAARSKSTEQSWANLQDHEERTEHEGVEKVVLLDTDAKSLPMFLNVLISLANFYDSRALAKMVHVLCLDQESCAFTTQAGFTMVGGGTASAVRQGFNEKVDNSTYSGNWLDDICLAREQALMHLLTVSKLVLRTDNDVCFLEDPFVLQQKTGAGLVVSAQPLSPSFEGGMWSYDWRCNSTTGAALPLTLNNGVMVIDGRNADARNLYGQAYGLGVKLLGSKKNGWVSGFWFIDHVTASTVASRAYNLCMRQMMTECTWVATCL